MSLRLSNAEIAAIERANTILLSPFAFEDGESWRRAAARAVEDCIGGDASSFALPVPGERLIAATPEVSQSLQAVDPPPDWVVHGLTVRRRELGLTVTNWDELFEGSQVRRTSFYNDIVRPQGLMAPVVMVRDTGMSPIPAAVSVYFNDEKRADKGLRRRKAMLRLLYPAFCSAINTYVANRKNIRELHSLAERASISMMCFDGRGVCDYENEPFRRLVESDPERGRVRAEAARVIRRIVDGPLYSSPSDRTTAELRTRCGHYRIVATLLQNASSPGSVRAVVVVEKVESKAIDAQRLAAAYSLTQREIEIAQLVRKGLSTKEIAETLGITTNTTRRHLENVYLKLQVHTRTAAAAKLSGN